MILDLIDQLQGMMIGLKQRDSMDLQNQTYRDDMMHGVLHFMRGLGMQPPTPHYGPHRGRGRGRGRC